MARICLLIASLCCHGALSQDSPPAECMAIMNDNLDAIMKENAPTGDDCMHKILDPVDTKAIADGTCTQSELDTPNPPCDDSKCFSTLMAAAKSAYSECIPAAQYPYTNAFVMCVMRHQCSASVSTFSMAGRFGVTRFTKVMIALSQDSPPAECMAIWNDNMDAIMKENAPQGDDCMHKIVDPVDTKAIADGTCTQSELDSPDPPCDDPKCLSTLMAAGKSAYNECVPAAQYPYTNAFAMCLLNPRCSASVSKFSMAGRFGVTRFTTVMIAQSQDSPPAECMAIWNDNIDAIMKENAPQGDDCMRKIVDPVDTKAIADGTCTQSELDSPDPPCDDPKCLSTLMAAGKSAYNECIPAAQYPYTNAFAMCLLNPRCSASVSKFSMAGRFDVTRYTKRMIETALAVSPNVIVADSGLSRASMLVGCVSGMVGAMLVLVLLKRQAFNSMQQPLIA